MFKTRAVKIIKKIVGKISRVILLLIFSLSIFTVFSNTHADNISDKQNELDSLQSQIGQYQSIIKQKQRETSTL